jgi:D-alanyl-D-alanine endopeptidase (penicillin-binding protein 7)
MGEKRNARWGLWDRFDAKAVALVLVCLVTPPSIALAAEGFDTTTVVADPINNSTEPRVVRHVAVRKSKRVPFSRASARMRYEPLRPSVGQVAGLELKSSAALVVDQETNQVLFSKNAGAVLPIASLTKLMTALVVAEAKLPFDELITVSQDDVDTEKGSRSRLKVGTQLSRSEMLHLALMASENRAAHALGRNFPGGSEAFVAAMNSKAQALGMADTKFVESTGLSSRNQSSARDLATLVGAAHEHAVIREMSISPRYQVEIGRRNLAFHNTNRLISSAAWDIGLQKTGYIAEAGRCLVMQVTMSGRPMIMVFLDSAGKYSRLGDAERVRRWVIESAPWIPGPSATPALPAAGTEPKLTS